MTDEIDSADALDVLRDMVDAKDHLPFEDILSRLHRATVSGPDDEGLVWLTASTECGDPISLNIGRPGDDLADEALRWRARG